ncbi:MAG TPA: hypothetical protein VI216_02180 [Candidatus Acidoferrales bacterium]
MGFSVDSRWGPLRKVEPKEALSVPAQAQAFREGQAYHTQGSVLGL